MKPGKVTTPVILGQPWQRTYNGMPHWKREGITYEKDGIRYFTPFLEEECYTSDDPSDTESHAQEPLSPPNNQKECAPGQANDPTLPKEAALPTKTKNPQPLKPSTAIWVPTKIRQAQDGQAQIWIPKRSPQHISTKTMKPQAPKQKNHNANKRKNNPKRTHTGATHKKFQSTRSAPQTKPQQRWVPKKALSAQGYYQGATHVWLPKPMHAKPTTTKTAPVTSTKANHKWVPKQKQTDPLPQQPTKTIKRATAQEKGKWIPKQPPSVQSNKPFNTTQVKSRKSIIPNKGKWIPKITQKPQEVLATVSKPSTSQATSTQRQEEQASRAQLSNKARQLAYLLMTLNQEKLVKLWLQQQATKANTSNAASTTQATGPHLLQYPPLAQQ